MFAKQHNSARDNWDWTSKWKIDKDKILKNKKETITFAKFLTIGQMDSHVCTLIV